MGAFQIIMLIIGLLMVIFSFYIGYVFFLGSSEKKSAVSLIADIVTNDIRKFVLGLIEIVGLAIIIGYVIKIIMQ